MLATQEIYIDAQAVRETSETDPAAATLCQIPTGNLLPLLHEIRHALARWLESETPHIIDLRCLPLSPAEEDQLLRLLGRGEVEAKMSSLGASDIFETAVAGVWVVNHYNDSDVPVGRFIEICALPDILMTQREDAEFGLGMLEQLISNEESKA